MSTFMVLFRIQMAATFGSFTGGTRTKKTITNGKKQQGNRRIGKIGMGLLWGFCYLMFMVVFVSLFISIAEPFHTMGLGWLYMTMQMLITAVLMLVGTVFLAKSLIFEAKDNMTLLAMPIPPRIILLVRMVSLYVMNLIWGSVVLIPALVCWFIYAGFSISVLLLDLLLFLAAGLFTLSLSCLLGFAIAALSARLRNKTIVTVLISMVFMIAYIYVYSVGYTKLIDAMVNNSNAIAETLGAVAPLYWIGVAIAEHKIVPLLLSLCILVIPFVLVYALMSATFLKTATTAHGVKRIKYRINEADEKVNGLSIALLKRENARFCSSPSYLLNGAFGLFFLLICPVALIWKWDLIKGVALLLGQDKIAAVFLGVICMMLCMTLITAPSVSLEAKTLWQIRSMPVTTKDILHAKLKLHLIWCAIPSILMSIFGLIFLFSGNANIAPEMFGEGVTDEMLSEVTAQTTISTFDYIINGIALIVFPQLYSVVSGGIGLLLGLKYPNLNWTNEVQVVKQGSAVMLTMFGNMAVVVAVALSVVFASAVIPVSILLLLWMVVFAVLSICIYRALDTWGVKKFNSLPV